MLSVFRILARPTPRIEILGMGSHTKKLIISFETPREGRGIFLVFLENGLWNTSARTGFGFGLLCRHTASNSITTETHTSGVQY